MRVSRTICVKFPLGGTGPRNHTGLFVPSSCLLCDKAGIAVGVENVVESKCCAGYEPLLRSGMIALQL